MEAFSHHLSKLEEDKLPLFFRAYYFNSGFNDEEIDRLKKIAENLPEKNADLLDLYGNTQNNENIRSSLIRWFDNTDPAINWLLKRLEQMAIEANATMRWNFSLSGFYENIQYARYDSAQKGHFSEHCDVGAGMGSYRKISISVQLSDTSDYEGGELELHGLGAAPKEKGGVIIFPSFLMHKVSPVTKGVRESLVGWVSGPPYK